MNIVIFGPNGSGKGTQGAQVQKKYGVAHIESGVIFRDASAKGTPLGLEAKKFTERGELVPDSITIPMVLERLTAPDCAKGWLLDGFPRTPAQARALDEAARAKGMRIDCVIEIVLTRELAKQRIMGRRLCVKDGNHPNNVAIEAIKPAGTATAPVCRVCGGALKTRADDQDEAAVGRRHDIYYNSKDGTLGAVAYFAAQAKAEPKLRFVQVDGAPSVKDVTAALIAKLG